VKALDSGIRLPAQVHPDRALARSLFNSAHGKTETWLIMATPAGANIYFGFKEGDARGPGRTSEKSEHDPDAFLEISRSTRQRWAMLVIRAGRCHRSGRGASYRGAGASDYVIAAGTLVRAAPASQGI